MYGLGFYRLVDEHGRTIILGFTLMRAEVLVRFRWVFANLQAAFPMGLRCASQGGNKLMALAIYDVSGDVTIRLPCTWRLA
mmetsp:Transcript_15241/g.44601  ORF Transcript_15241/g.44601 Transcript_15241/m.44601 type:complete len:81 (-) Transcript_15241:1058-1300(-)